MTGTKLVLCVAGGVMLGGLGLCGIGYAIVNVSKGRTPTQGVQLGNGRRITAEAERMNARQIALAALEWASDHNDDLPTPVNFRRCISEYLKAHTAEVLEGFVWTFPGGKTTEIENPRSTQLGFIEDELGQTIAYADGHVERSAKSGD